MEVDGLVNMVLHLVAVQAQRVLSLRRVALVGGAEVVVHMWVVIVLC